VRINKEKLTGCDLSRLFSMRDPTKSRLRLVMPPTLFFLLSYPFTQLAHLIFPKPIANGIISGAFTFCESFTPSRFPFIPRPVLTFRRPLQDILYDVMHYALHHSKLPKYLAEMKRYHLAHHYKSELPFYVLLSSWTVRNCAVLISRWLSC
jgi:4-hydroxysphinganine ceramide fatty acyl 2-hydroxylase